MASVRTSTMRHSQTALQSLRSLIPYQSQNFSVQIPSRCFSTTKRHSAQLPDQKAPGLKPKPASSSSPSPPPQSKSKPSNVSLPIAAANRFIIDGLTARSGPGAGVNESRKGQPLRPGEELPEKYRPAARKITAIMLALPVVFVIGYVLFQRQFLGVEKKRLVRAEEGSEGEGSKRS